MTTIRPMKCSPAVTGLKRSSRLPAQPCSALVGNWEGAKSASSTNRLSARLKRLEVLKTLIRMPSDARKTASSVPTTRPAASASGTIPTPLPSRHT